MGARDWDATPLSNADGAQRFQVDVLVLGGGPAGAWAAISARARGATVLLADKGYCGTSGATAPSAKWRISRRSSMARYTARRSASV